jgi:hypothetical protein
MDYTQLSTFLKYCSDDEKVINGIFLNHKIRFTQPAALNDPLEFNPIIHFTNNGSNYTKYIFDGILFPSEEIRIRTQLIESHLNTFGILSLTKLFDSFDMWNRYANGHKGFIIEFKPDFNKHPCMLSRDGTEYPVRQVEYVDEYSINIDDLVDECGWIASKKSNEIMFFTKTSRWKNEMEYRMVRNFTDYPNWQPSVHKPHRDRSMYLFDFSLDCIESVTFGACMSIDNKKKIINACKGIGIKLGQAIIIRDQKDRWNQPAKVVIAPAESFPNLLDSADIGMLAEQNYIEERNKPPVTVNKLSEIPYYIDDKDWVLQYYKNRKTRLKL